jgi:hypothetical protein
MAIAKVAATPAPEDPLGQGEDQHEDSTVDADRKTPWRGSFSRRMGRQARAHRRCEAGLTLRTVMMMVFVVVTIIGTPMMVVAVFAVVVIVLGSGAMSYLRCCRTRILQRWKMAMILGGQQPSTNQCDERVAHRFKQVRPGIDLKA